MIAALLAAGLHAAALDAPEMTEEEEARVQAGTAAAFARVRGLVDVGFKTRAADAA